MPLTSRFQNLVSTADSQWGPVPCYVKKKMLVKSSQVSDVMSKFRIVTMKISSVVLSSQVFRRECDQQRTVLLGYWWLHETFLQCQLFLFKFTIESKLLRFVIERKFTTRRSRPNDLREVDFVSPRNPFPSCRYRRCNGGWCLPTSGRRGAPRYDSRRAPRTWIADIIWKFGYDNCCNILLLNVYFKR